MIKNRIVSAALAGTMILCALSASAQETEKKRKGLTLKTPSVSPRGVVAGGSALSVRVKAVARGGKITSVTAFAQLAAGGGATRTVTLSPTGGGFYATGTDRVLVPTNTKKTDVNGFVVVKAVSTVGTKTARVKIRIRGASGDSGAPPPPPPI